MRTDAQTSVPTESTLSDAFYSISPPKRTPWNDFCALMSHQSFGPSQPPYVYEYIRPLVLIEPALSNAANLTQTQAIIFVSSEIGAHERRDTVC